MDFSQTIDKFLEISSNLFLSYGSTFALSSLACAFVIALAYMVGLRLRKHRKLRLKTLFFGLFPKKVWKSDSNLADIRLFLLNAFVMGSVFGWAIFTFQTASEFTSGWLVSSFGARSPAPIPDFLARSIVTLMLFLAYEFSYWLDHYLSHRIPFLWEFHKVHHSAEHLTPLTVWRMHPVNTILFANTVALVVSQTNSVVCYLLGGDVYEYAVSGTNILLVVAVHLYIHLQHSHIWISFQGLLGRTVMSPAHHQIHHSNNPEHFNKNLGSCLAIWDWVFGTLHIPAKEPEKLVFGIDSETDVNTISAGLITPFIDAAKHVLPAPKGEAPAGDVKPV